MNFKSPDRYQIFLGLYLLIALLTATTSAGEMRPFFNGHWFVFVPYEVQDYGIFLQTLRGEKLERPIYLDRSTDFQKTAWAFDIYGLEQELGRAIEAKDEVKVQAIQKKLKILVFKNEAADIEIHQRLLNPRDFVNSQQVKNFKVLRQIQL